jgi:hypothetical protein
VPLDPAEDNHEPVDDDPLPDEIVGAPISSASRPRPSPPCRPTTPKWSRCLRRRSIFAEIGAILDIDEGAARVRFHRAKALLRQHLRTFLDEP